MKTQPFMLRTLDQEQRINTTKQVFENALMTNLNLTKVRAPLFVSTQSGLNDNLNGIEKPVTFQLNNETHEVVHSLAKWKRWYLGELKAIEGEGIVTDMHAIRTDESLSDIHSNLVDQWDWEKVISKADRSLSTLIQHGQHIYAAIKHTHNKLQDGQSDLPNELTVIHTEELLQKYPKLSPKEREHAIAKEHRAVFLIGIGGELSHGQAHDLRAPDYDDWTTRNESGGYGLNADILVWDKTRAKSLELSSMGIRVDKAALEKQLKIKALPKEALKPYHHALLNEELPYTIGGGIGQSRMFMFINHISDIALVQPIY